MVYFFLTFFSVVVLYKKEYSISHYLLISIPIFSGIIYLISLLGLTLPFNRYVDGLSLLLFLVFFLHGSIAGHWLVIPADFVVGEILGHEMHHVGEG